MITRSEYMDRTHTHAEYYGQFVTPAITRLVAKRVGINRLQRSTDEHLNDIPLSEWDGMGFEILPEIRGPLKAAGDFDSMAGRVCILKAAARMLLAQSRILA